ncbi:MULTISPECIES: TetR/AcrR family transcriptional regulator [Patulibacter]|jgi:AcrR family transcriptional regulator|uniref:Unannotated protein n=1 Tax=freshwater metagenome TaxID=449393 RepID=A0A6J7HHM7_9ZZZZ|nr:TetR/AcrR family transcriptional regulator [Patulibacter minatonensis]MSW50800.1 TetR family transcriptional regulator [Actinomycetota bacterium]
MAVLSKRDDPEARGRAEAELIEAVVALLTDGTPYASLSISKIAERAGHTRTGFYFYFRDKRDLLMSATSRLVEELFRGTTTWLEGPGGSAELQRALSQVLHAYRRSSALLRALIEATTYDAVIATYWHDEIGRFIAATAQRLERDGLPATQARGTADALVWMVERVYYQRVLNDDPEEDKLAIDSLTAIWARTLNLST